MKKSYPLFGIIAPLFYAVAVIMGGFLIQGYSHMYNSISELTASNVPKIPVIYFLFFMYNISLTLFGAGLYSNTKFTATIKVKLSSMMLIMIGVSGIAMLYFVQDPRNVSMSFNGKVHLILAAFSSLLTMITVLLLGLSFKKDPKFKKLTVYSFISLFIIFITGGIAAASTANNSSFGGLFERFTIGTFMQWVFVISISLFREVKNNRIRNKNFKSF